MLVLTQSNRAHSFHSLIHIHRDASSRSNTSITPITNRLKKLANLNLCHQILFFVCVWYRFMSQSHATFSLHFPILCDLGWVWFWDNVGITFYWIWLWSSLVCPLPEKWIAIKNNLIWPDELTAKCYVCQWLNTIWKYNIFLNKCFPKWYLFAF